MTKIFILLFVLTSCQSKQKDSKIDQISNQNSEIILNEELIDSLYRDDRLNPDNENFTYYKVKDFVVDLNNNQKPDSIILYGLHGWENDPGDFHHIEIIMDNGHIWKETNFLGWVRFDKNYQVPNAVKERNILDSDLILLTNFYSTKVLGLFGWAYASQPGLLTMIEFSTNTPRLILNRNWDILDINSSMIKTQIYDSKYKIELINNKIEIKKE